MRRGQSTWQVGISSGLDNLLRLSAPVLEMASLRMHLSWDAGQGLLDSRDEDDGPAVSVGPSNFIVKYPGKKDVSSASLADLHGWLLDLDRSIRSLCPGTGFSGSSSTPNAGASATPDVTAFSGPAACRGLDSLHHVLDVDTMIDYVLVEELVSNPDAYMTSVYAHRERGDVTCHILRGRFRNTSVDSASL